LPETLATGGLRREEDHPHDPHSLEEDTILKLALLFFVEITRSVAFRREGECNRIASATLAAGAFLFVTDRQILFS
jgi:hypothetical protein